MNIYFAHPVNTYKTEVEKNCLDIINQNLDGRVMNPGDDFLQGKFLEYRAEHPDTYMDFFKELVSRCDVIVYLPFRDKKIGAGAWFEVKEVMEKGHDGYEIDLENETMNKVDLDYVNANKLSIDETRIRIKTKY